MSTSKPRHLFNYSILPELSLRTPSIKYQLRFLIIFEIFNSNWLDCINLDTTFCCHVQWSNLYVSLKASSVKIVFLVGSFHYCPFKETESSNTIRIPYETVKDYKKNFFLWEQGLVQYHQHVSIEVKINISFIIAKLLQKSCVCNIFRCLTFTLVLNTNVYAWNYWTMPTLHQIRPDFSISNLILFNANIVINWH